MPVTFIAPAEGAPFGPGFLFHVQSDFIGPIPAGSHWDLSLYNHTTEEFLEARAPQLSTSHDFSGTWGIMPSLAITANPAFSSNVSGQSIELRAELKNSDAETIDSGTQVQTMNRTDGLPYLLSIFQTSMGTPSVVAADVSAIKAATFATFAEGVTVPISQMLGAPPMGFLSRELISPDRTGEGSLTRPSGPVGVDAFGIAWEVVGKAAGIGISEGAPDTLETHMLDLVLIHQLHDSNLEDTARASFNFGDALWMFPVPFPSSVSYWIGPGVTIRFYWLIISLG
jgi:hypothetical protein